MILRKWWLPISVILLIAITLASLLPVPAVGPPNSDKLVHLVSYAVLMFPAAYAANKQPLYYALFYLVWSGGIELIQPAVNRSAEWQDLFANSIGLMIGLMLGRFARRYF